ncbi:MAG: DHA2 family efflux MFS transporter permease subunit [Hyphomicrobiaceae bacterium]
MALASETSPGSNPSTVDRVLVAIPVMLATFMIIIDMTVVNVALPDMMGALAATPDQITWVLTSYIVAEAVTIPLSGFLAERFGRRRVILVSVAGFVAASMLCGQATSLTAMVAFRVLQGVFGASVIPISQSTLVASFDEKSRGKAMAIWGIGIMLGPVLGPTLGGFITDSLGWRFVFYINLPVGLLNLVLLATFLSEQRTRPSRVDWIGAALLGLGIASLQTLLDRGNTENWFQSKLIVALAVVSVAGLASFTWRSWSREDAILRISLMRDRNLASASVMMLVFGLGLFGTIALQPLMLETLLGYPASTTGLVMAPRGLAAALGMATVAVLINRIGPRWLVLAGLVMAGIGTYQMTGYSLQVDMVHLVLPSLVQGYGMGMVFVPLSTLAFQTVGEAATDRAASIFNLARTIGSSIGIAIAATVLTRMNQTSWMLLGGHISRYNPLVADYLAARGLSPADPLAPAVLAAELARQSSMIGFLDAFYFIAMSFVVLAPLVLLLGGGKGRAQHRR